jgi:Tfp pilus assembly protein PilZ
VQPLDTRELSEQIAESMNISMGGVFFASARPLKVGMSVELFLEIPGEIATDSSREWHCKGRVVHVRPYFLPFGKSGVGIQFDSREVVRIADFLASRYPEVADGNDQA